MDSIGMIELNSIAKGVEVADAVLKAAETRLLAARAVCPGKYHVLFAGAVAAVAASTEAATALAGRHLVDHTVIARVHPQVIEAIACTSPAQEPGALGVMEFFSVTAAVYGADAAVKAADVTLLDVRMGTGIGGKSYVVLTGQVSAVEEAVACGVRQALQDGLLVQQTIIANPRPEIFESLL